MILPFQVTQVSNYLVLDGMGILNSHWSLILPGIWSTLPVFIMTRSLRPSPDPLVEAAYLDGGGAVVHLCPCGTAPGGIRALPRP